MVSYAEYNYSLKIFIFIYKEFCLRTKILRKKLINLDNQVKSGAPRKRRSLLQVNGNRELVSVPHLFYHLI